MKQEQYDIATKLQEGINARKEELRKIENLLNDPTLENCDFILLPCTPQVMNILGDALASDHGFKTVRDQGIIIQRQQCSSGEAEKMLSTLLTIKTSQRDFLQHQFENL
jgi:cellulose biosynthesis protein BcsQ